MLLWNKRAMALLTFYLSLFTKVSKVEIYNMPPPTDMLFIIHRPARFGADNERSLSNSESRPRLSGWGRPIAPPRDHPANAVDVILAPVGAQSLGTFQVTVKPTLQIKWKKKIDFILCIFLPSCWGVVRVECGVRGAFTGGTEPTADPCPIDVSFK